MYNNTKQIEVKGKKYTLTAKRSIIFRLNAISPELIKIFKFNQEGSNKKISEEELLDLEATAGGKLYDNINVLFYEMIKTAHPDITEQKSNEIYWDFQSEYNDVDEKLISFLYSAFTDGIPREKKKNLDW